MVVGGYFKLIVFGSVLNKFRYAGLWNGDDDNDIADFNLVWLDGFSVYSAPSSYHLANELKSNIRQSAFNIVRTLWLYWPMIAIVSGRSVRKFIAQIIALVPSLIITIFLVLKPIGAILVLQYTQREYTNEGDFSVNHYLNLAIANAFFGFYLTCLIALPIQFYIHGSFQTSEFYKKVFGEIPRTKETSGKKGIGFVKDKIIQAIDEGSCWEFCMNDLKGALACQACYQSCCAAIIAVFSLAATVTIGRSLDNWNGYFYLDIAMSFVNLMFFILVCVFSCRWYSRTGKKKKGAWKEKDQEIEMKATV